MPSKRSPTHFFRNHWRRALEVVVFAGLIYEVLIQSHRLHKAKRTISTLMADLANFQQDLAHLQQKRYPFTPLTLPFPPPKPYRQYHRCNFERFPRILSIYDSVLYLTLTNKSLARFGDYDIEIITERPVYFQTNNDSLRKALLYVFNNSLPTLDLGLSNMFSGFTEIRRSIINDWMDSARLRTDLAWMQEHANYSRYYLSTMLTTPYVYSRDTYCNSLDQIYDLFQSIWRDKDVVILRGNNTQVYEYDIYGTARSQKILWAPRYNAWDSYESLRDKLLEEDPSALYILAAGPVSKILAYDLAKSGRRALDLGHLAKDYNLYKQGGSTKHFWVD